MEESVGRAACDGTALFPRRAGISVPGLRSKAHKATMSRFGALRSGGDDLRGSLSESSGSLRQPLARTLQGDARHFSLGPAEHRGGMPCYTAVARWVRNAPGWRASFGLRIAGHSPYAAAMGSTYRAAGGRDRTRRGPHTVRWRRAPSPQTQPTGSMRTVHPTQSTPCFRLRRSFPGEKEPPRPNGTAPCTRRRVGLRTAARSRRRASARLAEVGNQQMNVSVDNTLL